QVKFVLLAFAKQRMEAPPYTILRNDLKTRRSFSPVAAKAKSPEHRIVCENGCGGAKRATVTEIYLARVVPGPSMMRLIEPRLAVGRRLKSATGAAVILTPRIPVTVIRFRRSAVHQSPRAQVRSIAKPQIPIGARRVIQRVVEYRPAA